MFNQLKTQKNVIFNHHTSSYPLCTYIQHIIYAKGQQPAPYLMELHCLMGS